MAKTKEASIYFTLKDRHKTLFHAMEALGRAARSEGPLDEKTAQLIELVAAAAIRSGRGGIATSVAPSKPGRN